MLIVLWKTRESVDDAMSVSPLRSVICPFMWIVRSLPMVGKIPPLVRVSVPYALVAIRIVSTTGAVLVISAVVVTSAAVVYRITIPIMRMNATAMSVLNIFILFVICREYTPPSRKANKKRGGAPLQQLITHKMKPALLPVY